MKSEEHYVDKLFAVDFSKENQYSIGAGQNRLEEKNMQKKLEKRVLAYCNRHHMLEKGDSVVLGVSGGADSVCLLFVLLSLQKEWDLKLHVVHVNHGIRPDAGEDADYVKGLCAEHKIPFYLIEANIPGDVLVWGCSEEEAGRRVRYDAFTKVCVEQKCTKIAVAHNRNDCAETMLFHLFRGTGLTGLTGIRPIRGNIIRPILCLERFEIEAYLAQCQIAYRHDSTNDSDDYTRNKIRHHILPYAQEEIVNGCVANMTRSADILAETENYIEEQLKTAWKHCVTVREQKKPCFHIDRQIFLQEHSFIQKRLVLQVLKELSPYHQDIAAVHVEAVLGIFGAEGNPGVDLPYGIRAYRQYEEVVLEGRTGETNSCTEPDSTSRQTIEIPLADIAKGPLEIPFRFNQKVYLELLDVSGEGINCKDIPQNQYTKWLDYDKIKGCMVLRTRRQGDYLCIRGKEGVHHKKLKDYMITEKIPRQYREEMPLLAVDKHVLWLIGYRISEYYKVDTNTKHILQITCKVSTDT